MCIALLSTSHPKYPFILLNNRDEFLSRPTLNADWWVRTRDSPINKHPQSSPLPSTDTIQDPPNQHVLGGRDIQRAEHGTWLGITRQGRIAILTNFREEGVEVTHDKSRGAIPSAWLAGGHKSSAAFASHLIDRTGIDDVGGFSLLFGSLRAPDSDGCMPGLSVLSNRSSSAEEMRRIATRTGETHGLSNSHFGDVSWPKVVHGERFLEQAIQGSVERDDGEEALLESLFEILGVDMLRQREEGETWEVYVRQMRNSILIPPVKGITAGGKEIGEGIRKGVNGTASPERMGNGMDAGAGAGYGTQKQTVVLVDRAGHVVYIERTLYDERGSKIYGDQADRRFEFDIEGWNA